MKVNITNNRTRYIIVIIAVVSLAAIAAGVYLISPYLMLNTINRDFSEGEYQHAVDRSVKLMQRFPASKEARSAASQVMQHIEYGSSEVIIGNSFMFRSGSVDGAYTISSEDYPFLFDLFERVAGKQRNPMWKWNVYEWMGDTAMKVDDLPRAESYYLKAIAGFAGEQRSFRISWLQLNLIEIYAEIGNEAKAREMAESLIDDPDTQDMDRAAALSWLGVLQLESGERGASEISFTAAQELTRRALESIPQSDDRKQAVTDAAIQPAYMRAAWGLNQLELLDFSDSHPEETAALTVRIEKLGEPLADVRFLLRPAELMDSFSTNEFNNGMYPTTVTDGSGEAEFAPVMPGEYELVLMADADLLYDIGAVGIPESVELSEGEQKVIEISLREKVKILTPAEPVELTYGNSLEMAWETYPGAVDYGIEAVYFTGDEHKRFSSSVGMELQRTENTSINWDTDDSELTFRLGVYSPERVYPVAVAGLFHPDAYFSLAVTAYGDNGLVLSDSDGLIYDNSGIYPLFHILEPEDSRLVPEGDRLLLQGEYEEALESYRSAAAEGDAAAAASAEALERALEFQ